MNPIIILVSFCFILTFETKSLDRALHGLELPVDQTGLHVREICLSLLPECWS